MVSPFQLANFKCSSDSLDHLQLEEREHVITGILAEGSVVLPSSTRECQELNYHTSPQSFVSLYWSAQSVAMATEPKYALTLKSDAMILLYSKGEGECNSLPS